MRDELIVLAQRQLGFQLLLPYRMRGRRVSALDALDDRRLARAATDALIARGVDAAGPMLALALLQALRESCPPLILRRAVELCAHLALTMCFIEGEQSGAPEASTLRSLLDDDIGQLNEALRVYWAVVKAALDLSADLLAVPLENDLPPSMHAVWRRLRVRLAHKRIVVVAEPLVRELARRLPTAARDEEAEAAP